MEPLVEKKFLLPQQGFSLYNNKGDTSKRWYIEYYTTLPAGVKKRVKVYGYINRHSNPEKRYKAAVALVDKILAGEHNPDNFEAANLQALFSKYFAERTRNLRSKTTSTYQTKVNAFIEYCRGKRIDNLSAINRSFARSFLATVKKNPTTINTYRDTLRTFFEDFRRDKLINENPFAEIQKVPEARRGKFPFNAQQVAQLKQVISRDNPVLWMGCLLEFYCFIRPAESRFLKVEDINLAEDFILLHASISKNKKTQPVSIPAPFKAELEKWIEGLPQNFYALNRSPKPVHRDFLNKAHKKILKEKGFSNRYSFYSWKHTGAFMAIKAGISLKDLQMQMRHHSLDQLNEYLREMGVMDSVNLKNNFPAL